MITILHVSPAGERGGVETAVLTILRNLDRSRFLPLLVLLEDGRFAGEARHAGIEVHVFKASRVRNVWQLFRTVNHIANLITRRGVSVVHTHNAKAHLYGSLAAARTGVPCVFHLHGVPRPTLNRAGVVDLLSVLLPSRVTMACSAYVAEQFKQSWRSRREVVVLHNGVELPSHLDLDARAEIRAEFEIPADAPLVLLVSRLQRWKGVHIVLDAAARVLAERKEARFIIVGGSLFELEENYASELRQQAQRLGLGQSVRFAGFRSDVLRFYSAAAIVVHSSIEPEPFGLVLLEAMVRGRPVVASDSGGPREIVVNGVNGFLVRPGDAGALAKAVLTLLDDPLLAVRMGLAGEARVRESFGADRMLDQLQGVYLQMQLG